MVNNPELLEQVQTKFTEIARHEETISALILYGSKADGTNDLLSDLDLFVLTSDIPQLIQLVKQVTSSYTIKYTDRFVLFFFNDSSLSKVDISYSTDLEKFAGLLGGRDYKVLVDKIGLDPIHPNIENNTMVYHLNRAVESYYNLAIAKQSSDRYRFMFYQFLFLQHLYTLEYHLAGETVFSYLPLQLTRNIPEEVKSKYSPHFDPNSDLISGNWTITRYLDWIKDVVCRLEKTGMAIPRNLDELLRNIYRQNLYWNFRDIALVNPKKIKANVLYRSSSPHLFEMHDISEKLNLVKSTLDLRNEEEISSGSYHLDKIAYYNVKIGAKHVTPHRMIYSEIGVDPFFYEYFPRHYHEEIAEIFRIILKAEKPTLIHCFAGKDRTGMIVAFIHKLLGLSDEELMMDYASSRHNTDRNKIKITLKVVDEFGGIENYLATVGLTPNEIDELKRCFTPR